MFARTLTALLLSAAPVLAAPPEAPMPRAAGVAFPPPPHPMWYDPEVCPPEQLRLWHRMHFDSVYSAPFTSYQAQRDIATRSSARFHPLLQGDWRTAQRDHFLSEYMRRSLESVRFVAPPAGAEPTVCPPCPLPKIEVNPLLGTWYREVPGCVACATFTHDELKLTFTESDGAKHTATAQYTVTKDGLVFGAITGTSGPASLVDVPFSFRFRVTSDGVMVSAFKSEPLGDTARFCGLFKSAKDGKVPAPVAAKKDELRIAVPNLSPLGSFLDYPLPMNSRNVPQERARGVFDGPDVAPPIRPAALETAPVVLPPVLDGPPPVPPKRPNASAPPDAFKLFAEDAFGSLLQQSGVLPKPEPDPLPLAPPAKKLAHVGTWHRAIGPMTCVVKIDAEHVTFTGYICAEENGKKVKQGVVLTGDYHLARDGTTLVGLVTGLDVLLEGDTGKAADLLEAAEQVSKVQKALVGKPFAFTVRAYGDALMIGDVSVPRVGDSEIDAAHAMIAGRYKSGEPKAAEPKALPRATGASAPRIPMADAEDLSIIQNEWSRFWFPDAPRKPTPERVHGGIY